MQEKEKAEKQTLGLAEVGERVRKTSMLLQCQLTEEEMLAAGKQLAEANDDLVQIENLKSEVTATFKAKTTAAEARIGELSRKVRNGYEYRQVDCLVQFDTPDLGMKQTVRTDTNEIVEKPSGMTDDEKQMLLIEE